MRRELPELELRGDDELRHAPDGFELELVAAGSLDPTLVGYGRLDEAGSAGDPFAAGRQPWPIMQTCSRELRAVHDSGSRPRSAIRWLVVHCTQGFTARSAASWFADPRSAGSAHVCVDGFECYRTLPIERIPWGARGANEAGWHLEIAGFAEWSRAEWRARDRLLRRAAFKLAVHSLALDIELRTLSLAQIRARARGVITHRQCTAVFGGSHSDPGTGFPMGDFLQLARQFKGEIRRRRA